MLMKTKIYGYPKKLYSAWEIVKLNTQRLRKNVYFLTGW